MPYREMNTSSGCVYPTLTPGGEPIAQVEFYIDWFEDSDCAINYSNARFTFLDKEVEVEDGSPAFQILSSADDKYDFRCLLSDLAQATCAAPMQEAA